MLASFHCRPTVNYYYKWENVKIIDVLSVYSLQSLVNKRDMYSHMKQVIFFCLVLFVL